MSENNLKNSAHIRTGFDGTPAGDTASYTPKLTVVSGYPEIETDSTGPITPTYVSKRNFHKHDDAQLPFNQPLRDVNDNSTEDTAAGSSPSSAVFTAHPPIGHPKPTMSHVFHLHYANSNSNRTTVSSRLENITRPTTTDAIQCVNSTAVATGVDLLASTARNVSDSNSDASYNPHNESNPNAPALHVKTESQSSPTNKTYTKSIPALPEIIMSTEATNSEDPNCTKCENIVNTNTGPLIRTDVPSKDVTKEEEVQVQQYMLFFYSHVNSLLKSPNPRFQSHGTVGQGERSTSS
jgi:ABC-type antimicrobial peptide transport system permease subunit